MAHCTLRRRAHFAHHNFHSICLIYRLIVLCCVVCASHEIESGWHEPCSIAPYLVLIVTRVLTDDRCVKLFNYYCQITIKNHNGYQKKKLIAFSIKFTQNDRNRTKTPAQLECEWNAEIRKKNQIKSRSYFKQWLFALCFYTFAFPSHISDHICSMFTI